MKAYLGDEESEVSFLILKEDIVSVGIDFLRSVVELQAVVQILLISLVDSKSVIMFQNCIVFPTKSPDE